jgi:hypothetical protein
MAAPIPRMRLSRWKFSPVSLEDMTFSLGNHFFTFQISLAVYFMRKQQSKLFHRACQGLDQLAALALSYVSYRSNWLFVVRGMTKTIFPPLPEATQL